MQDMLTKTIGKFRSKKYLKEIDPKDQDFLKKSLQILSENGLLTPANISKLFIKSMNNKTLLLPMLLKLKSLKKLKEQNALTQFNIDRLFDNFAQVYAKKNNMIVTNNWIGTVKALIDNDLNLQKNLDVILDHKEFPALLSHISTFSADGILNQDFLDKLISQNNLNRLSILLQYVPPVTWTNTELLSSTMDFFFDCNKKLGIEEISPQISMRADQFIDALGFQAIMDECNSATTEKEAADIFNNRRLLPNFIDLPTWRNVIAILTNKKLNTKENFTKLLQHKNFRQLLKSFKPFALPILSTTKGHDIDGVFSQRFIDKMTSPNTDLIKFKKQTKTINPETWRNQTLLVKTLDQMLDSSTSSRNDIASIVAPRMPLATITENHTKAIKNFTKLIVQQIENFNELLPLATITENHTKAIKNFTKLIVRNDIASIVAPRMPLATITENHTKAIKNFTKLIVRNDIASIVAPRMPLATITENHTKAIKNFTKLIVQQIENFNELLIQLFLVKKTSNQMLDSSTSSWKAKAIENSKAKAIENSNAILVASSQAVSTIQAISTISSIFCSAGFFIGVFLKKYKEQPKLSKTSTNIPNPVEIFKTNKTNDIEVTLENALAANQSRYMNK